MGVTEIFKTIDFKTKGVFFIGHTVTMVTYYVEKTTITFFTND